MAKAKSPPEQEAPPSAPRDPLSSETGRAWLVAELEEAEHERALGPGGSGWAHNEGLRPAIDERAAFLRALVDLLK